MIDSITLKIEPPLLPNEVIREIKTAAGVKFNSKCRNMDLITTNDYTILKGSLPKFMHGSNVRTLSYEEVAATIQELSNHLGRDISNALILGVDWSTTIMTENKPKVYYSILGETHPFQRVPFKNSLYFNTSAKKLLFYDKGKEARVSGNLLRNEVRWSNLKKLGLHLNDLAKPEVFTRFTRQWLDVYQSINKIRKPMPAKVRTPTDFNKYLSSIAIEVLGGKDEVISIINNLHSQGVITDYNKTRIKQNIVNLLQNIAHPTAMEEELNWKFTEVAKQNSHKP